MTTETKDKEMQQYSSKFKGEIRSKTKNIEACIVGCLWKSPELYLDYDFLDLNKFKNSIWKFYFNLGKKLAIKKLKTIEETDVELFLEGKESLKKGYDELGGFEIINDLKEVCTLENIDTYVQELIKWDIMWNIIEKFTLTQEVIKNLSNLKPDEVYDYYSALLNNSFVKTSNNFVANKIQDNIDEMIQKANEGLNRGTPINSPILNDTIGGLMDGQVILAGAGSGTGKTTFLLDCVLPSLADLKEQCVFMLNEQDLSKVQQQFLTYIINNIVITNPDEHFDSKRWREGKFTKREFELINEAKEILNKKIEDNTIVIVEFKSYNSREVIRIIKQYAGMGCKRFFLDTLKLSSGNATTDSFWLSMMLDVLEFSDLVKPANLNVNLYCTMQLQKINKSIRYLDNSLIGMSRNMIDTASVVMLSRRLYADEYPGMKHEITVKRPIAGTKSLEEVELNPNYHYQITFITKNRNGCSEEFQIVSRQELGYLIYEEVGIVSLMPD